MNVVSCYRAAKIAQVSKQCIAKQKAVNLSNKSKYRYFSYDKDSGEFGIDIDSKYWSTYMEKRRNQKGYISYKEKGLTTDTGVKSTQVDYKNNTDIDRLLESVEKTVIKIFKPSPKKNDEFFKELIKNMPTVGK